MAKEKYYSIKEICKYSKLSRTTLLYYENIGLFKASRRSAANYRIYTEQDKDKLDRILLYRSAGIELKEMVVLLSQKQNSLLLGFETRLQQIQLEIIQLQKQQNIITSLIKDNSTQDNSRIISKKLWIEMLRNAGLEDFEMDQWHLQFERDSPDVHQMFLESLNIKADEIVKIREKFNA